MIYNGFPKECFTEYFQLVCNHTIYVLFETIKAIVTLFESTDILLNTKGRLGSFKLVKQNVNK